MYFFFSRNKVSSKPLIGYHTVVSNLIEKFHVFDPTLPHYKFWCVQFKYLKRNWAMSSAFHLGHHCQGAK